MGSGLLAAFGHGIDEKMDPGKPEQQNMYEANAGKEKLPMTLGEALDKLDKDKLIQDALPGDMLRVFTEYKRDEWEEFLATPTQWDLDKYLDCLP
jgi:glutamine synthetase